ncbi:vitamin K epoxide reductase family protein [Pseudarthrobacter sp. P1]|uniref:vitamin K epoxide reductase family protein n=1 Tax=Pseudarthrobacter sp. P1 TaxID=3418418 RepID=UPI003CF11DE4
MARSKISPRGTVAARAAAASPARPTADDGESRLPLFARRAAFGWLLVVTGAVSWLASGILVLERLELYKNPDAITSCDINPWIACGTVMKTPQAALFGFPNPLIGVAAFAVIITTGMVLLSGAKLGRAYWLGLQTGVTLGMVMIVWLWSQALYVIGVLCPYCMVVWAMMIPMFVWVTVRNVFHGVIPAPEGLKKFLAEWAWIIVGLLYVAVIASIFFRFINIFLGGGVG